MIRTTSTCDGIRSFFSINNHSQNLRCGNATIFCVTHVCTTLPHVSTWSLRPLDLPQMYSWRRSFVVLSLIRFVLLRVLRYVKTLTGDPLLDLRNVMHVRLKVEPTSCEHDAERGVPFQTHQNPLRSPGVLLSGLLHVLSK